ncbi:LysR family transcriptional regulator [Budvicia diplopodorum]|uniref:LysR family transcriptional regulator n=1 Tax=Budvicia diplopodorum TaxID=1119056 RepID=UPI0013573453|nr:LysR family transcriptional regulator [Budvicia diplopodorum]
MNNSFDYNLIKFLVAIVDTRSMTGASEVLDTAPAAVSYAVAKLRKHYNDPLFVRSRNGVNPTTLAMNLYEVFNPINKSIADNITAKKGDVISRLKHPTIVVRANSIMEYWLTHNAIKQKIVPNKCTLDFVNHTKNIDKRVNALRTQEVDIDIDIVMESDRNIISTPLINVELTLICRKNHPRIKDSISLKQFSTENYVSRLSTYGSANVTSELENVFDSRTTMPWIRSESFINLLLNVIDNDVVMTFPKYLIPLITEKFPVKEVYCDFLEKKELYAFAYTHKQNIKNDLIFELIHLMQQ